MNFAERFGLFYEWMAPMSLLERVIIAHRCRSTHHYIAMDALPLLSGPDAEKWRKLMLVHNEELLKGAKAPDAVFKDFKNHVLHVGEGEWGGARDAAMTWYAEAVGHLQEKKWDKAIYALGVMSHYYADPIQPFHTGQTEEEGAIHRAVEWSIAKSRDVIKARIDEMGYPEIEAGEGVGFVSDMVRAGAEKSHPHYHTLIDHYNLDVGVKNPPAGLDQTLIDIISELVAYATAGLSVLYSRAFAEAGVAAPNTHITVPGYLSTLDIPIHWVAKKLDNAADKRIVTKMYREFKKTGKVIKTLPDDDKAIRKAHARQVMRRPLKELDEQELVPLGTLYEPRPEHADFAEEIARELAEELTPMAEETVEAAQDVEAVTAEPAPVQEIAAEEAKPAKKKKRTRKKPKVRVTADVAEPVADLAEPDTAANEDTERLFAEQAEAERLAAEQAEAERLAAAQAEAERLAAAQAEAERLAAEQAEAERLAAEQVEAERLAAAQAESERLAAEAAEQERIEAEEAARLEAEATAKAEAEEALRRSNEARAKKAAEEQARLEAEEMARIAEEEEEAARLAAEEKEIARFEAREAAEFARLKAEEEAEFARMEAEEEARIAAEEAELAAMEAEEAEELAAQEAERAEVEEAISDVDTDEFTLEELAAFDTNLTDNGSLAPPVESFFETPAGDGQSRERSRTRLALNDPVIDAPSIGKKTARRLNRVGIFTVEDLLNCDVEEIAFELDVRHIDEPTLEDWKAQATLMIEVAGLRVHDAQILVGAGIRNGDDLANASATSIFHASMGFLKTSEGARIVRDDHVLRETEVNEWIDLARESEAA